MTSNELEDLRTEYKSKLVGPLIFALVRKTLQNLLAKRNVAVYAPRSAASDALSDTVQDFIVDVLIEEAQLSYIFTVAESIDDLHRLLSFQARRYLARARTRTVIDNLIDRSLAFLRSAENVQRRTIGNREVFASNENTHQDSVLQTGLNRAVALAASIPKVASAGDQRGSAVYSAEQLKLVLFILMENYAYPVGAEELDDFFSKLLTAWKPSFLGLDEDPDPADNSLLPEEETVATSLANSLATAMTAEESLIFSFKHANVPDRELARKLGLSRQSLLPRKKRLFAKLALDLANLQEGVQTAVLERIAALLAKGAEDEETC